MMTSGDHELGLCVVNPRIERVQTTKDIEQLVDKALCIRPRKLLLNPVCGFSTFSARPVNNDVIAKKVGVDRSRREQFCGCAVETRGSAKNIGVSPINREQ